MVVLSRDVTGTQSGLWRWSWNWWCPVGMDHSRLLLQSNKQILSSTPQQMQLIKDLLKVTCSRCSSVSYGNYAPSTLLSSTHSKQFPLLTLNRKWGYPWTLELWITKAVTSHLVFGLGPSLLVWSWHQLALKASSCRNLWSSVYCCSRCSLGCRLQQSDGLRLWPASSDTLPHR